MDYQQLIILIAQDYTDHQMSKKLGYSHYYVRDCVSKLINKYKCRSRCGILLKALENKDIDVLKISTIVEN